MAEQGSYMLRAKRRKVARRRLFLLLFIIIVVIIVAQPAWMLKKLYPIDYKADIRASAISYQVDPHLVAAIIKAETNFQTGKVSKKGALGLMQIMPTTAKWIVEKAGFEQVTEETLRNRADVSIELGVWYLASLHKQFDENNIVVIAAYNAGPGKVRQWLDSGEWDGTFEEAAKIPYKETRDYVQKVVKYYNKYKDLYPELEP
ncbi:soluble lytic murein transglycosylase [Paenibacillus algorifonticola]|uniref:Soluble lytic murein transglycosylase n=1 Tax=Paenibacillus algorifonticola TaxID=684063 RepID=A0A1I2AMQ2_9BACL|nr:soluble lytic murein transglycosylase [Paenibacillus algorifonticola]